MALLQYLKAVDGLPDPKGPLTSSISSDTRFRWIGSYSFYERGQNIQIFTCNYPTKIYPKKYCTDKNFQIYDTHTNIHALLAWFSVGCTKGLNAYIAVLYKRNGVVESDECMHVLTVISFVALMISSQNMKKVMKNISNTSKFLVHWNWMVFVTAVKTHGCTNLPVYARLPVYWAEYCSI